MNSDRINPPSDQRRLTLAASTDKLQQHRKDANQFTQAYKYNLSQRVEISQSSNDNISNRDFQEIKVLGDQVRGHMEQMLAYLSEQDKLIHSLNEEFLQHQERVEKSERNNNKLPLKWNADTNQNRQQGDIIEQAENYINRLNNTKKFAFNEDFIKDWPDIKSTINKIIDKIEENGQLIHFIRPLDLIAQSKAKGKNSDIDSQDTKLIELAHNHITHLDNAIKQVQLEREREEFANITKNLKLHNHSIERQLKQSLQEHEKLSQEHEKLKRDNQESIELKEIMKKAKPGLPPTEVREAYKQLQDLHSQARHGDTISKDEHREAFKKLLGLLCPKTLQKSERDGIEFAINPNAEASYPWIKENAEGEWRIEFPLPHTRGIRGMVLRSFDLIQEIAYHRGGHEIIPPERRIEVIADVFRANAILGPRYGFSSEGNPLAEKYQKDFEDGIRKAYNEGKARGKGIEEIKEMGHEYAYDKLRESIKPPEGIPGIFPSLQPGGYFEESNIWEIFEGQQQAVNFGSPEFGKLREELKRRKQKGENYALTANILWNETTKSTEVWVQPYYLMKKLMSRHPMNAQGRHSIWSGEIHLDPETMAVACLKDQSGHYMTYDKNDPGRMAEFALKELKKRGSETSDTMIVLTAVEGPTTLEYENYELPSRDSGKPTKSEEYIKTKDSRSVSSPSSFLRWSTRDLE